MTSSRRIALLVVAVGAIGVSAEAQVPVRARSEISIPVRKIATPAPAPADNTVTRIVPGTKTEVAGTPVVIHIVRTEAGTPTVLTERAPTVQGGFAVPWLPLFGLLGGAILVHGLDNGHGGSGTPPPVTPPPVTPPPVTPPPVTPPPTTVPEPTTVILFATGLVALAFARKRIL